MIDLHLHLDGSLSEQDFINLAKKYDVSLGNDFPNNIYVPSDCPSLEEYLKRFDLPLLLLQSKDALIEVSYNLVKRLHELGYIYAEIRFAPQLHTQKGLSQYEAALAALEGVNAALKDFPDIDVNLILCCMRHGTEEVNMETIEVANKLKGTRVVAVDLAGAERLHPSTYYKNIFDRAKKYGLNITIHAGEATGSDEIMMAIDNGAMRIGHGVHLSLDHQSIKKVKDNDICFEFCPTSNLQTKSLKTYEDVPLRKFMEKDICVTINSDNMTVSNTNVPKEIVHMVRTFNLSKEEIKNLLLTSIKYSFTDEKVKEKLRKRLDERIDDFYERIKKSI